MESSLLNTRRTFLKTGAATLVGGALFESLPLNAYAQSGKTIKI